MEINQTHWIYILSKILYSAAALVLLLGLIILIGSFSYAANLSSSLIGLQVLGGEVIANLLAPFLRSALTIFGGVVFAINLVLSLALFAAGKLAAFAFDLSARLEKTEQALAQLQRQVSPGKP